MGEDLTWFFDSDIDVQEDLYSIGEKCSPPINDEHHSTTQHGPEQRQPHVVVLIRWPPAYTGRGDID